MNGIAWTKDELDYLKTRFPIEGRRCCERLKGRSWRAVSLKAHRLGIRYIHEYIVHIDLSRTHTPEFSYLLGFIWADGYLAENGRVVTINIAEEDGRALERVVLSTGSWSSRTYVRLIGGKRRAYRTFTVNDKAFYEWLVAHGFRHKSRRGFVELLKTWPKHLLSYVWRGYFDGDGCFYVKHTTIAGAATFDWSALRASLKRHDIKAEVEVQIRSTRAANSRLAITRIADRMRFAEMVYRDRLDIGLPRKQEPYMAWLTMRREKQVT